VCCIRTTSKDYAMGNYIECLEGPNGCHGEVAEYPALSGRGMLFARCESHHHDAYVARV